VLIPVSPRPLELWSSNSAAHDQAADEACGPAISSERVSLWEAWKRPETNSVSDRQAFFPFDNGLSDGFDVHEYARRDNA
jgi:hypothetical protein